MQTPEAIIYELEICMFGMAEDGDGSVGFRLAETMDDATSYDVELHLRFEQTGQIEILFEEEFSNLEAATEQFDILDKMYGDASHNIEPDR